MCVPAADAVTSACLGPGVCRYALRWGIGKLAGLCSDTRSRRRRHLRPVLSGPNVLLPPDVSRLCTERYGASRGAPASCLPFRASLPRPSQPFQHRTSLGKSECSLLDAGRFPSPCAAGRDGCVFMPFEDRLALTAQFFYLPHTDFLSLALSACASDRLIFR